MRLFAALTAFLAASPAFAESPGAGVPPPKLELERSEHATPVPPIRPARSVLDNEPRPPRQIRTSLDGAERSALGVDTSVRRFIRVTLDDSPSVATFPPLDVFAAREELDAASSGPVRASEPASGRPLRTGLQDGPASRPNVAARSIRADLDGERVALSTQLPARRIRTTLD